jgi:hypothetical protein
MFLFSMTRASAPTYSAYTVIKSSAVFNHLFSYLNTTSNGTTTDTKTYVYDDVNRIITEEYGTNVTSTFVITAKAGPNGSISPSGTISESLGATPTFTIIPSAGYLIQNVLVDGISDVS